MLQLDTDTKKAIISMKIPLSDITNFLKSFLAAMIRNVIQMTIDVFLFNVSVTWTTRLNVEYQ